MSWLLVSRGAELSLRIDRSVCPGRPLPKKLGLRLGTHAVASFKAYLAASPTAQDRADVQKRIRMIEKKKFVLPDQSAPEVAQVSPSAHRP